MIKTPQGNALSNLSKALPCTGVWICHVPMSLLTFTSPPSPEYSLQQETLVKCYLRMKHGLWCMAFCAAHQLLSLPWGVGISFIPSPATAAAVGLDLPRQSHGELHTQGHPQTCLSMGPGTTNAPWAEYTSFVLPSLPKLGSSCSSSGAGLS